MSKLEEYLPKHDIQTLEILKKAIDNNQVTVNCIGLYNNGKSSLLNMLIGDFELKTFKVNNIRETNAIKKILYENINYVDTPGLGHNGEDNEKVINAMKQSDITLFIHSIKDGEFNEKEINFFKLFKENWENSKIFMEKTIFVLSSIDEKNVEALKKIEQKSREQIENIFNHKALIIPVSSHRYRKGMIEGKKLLIKKSNIEKLKEIIRELSIKSIESIRKTRVKRLQNQYTKLIKNLNKELEKNQKKSVDLINKKIKRDNEFQSDIKKIEMNLNSKYLKLKEI